MVEKDLLQDRCGGIPYPITTQGELDSFSCGDEDLDDFFHNDTLLYAEQLLGKTYYFATNGDNPQIVCAFTLANDSIKAALIPNASRNKIQRKIPNSKRTRSYPAVLIGRLGVSRNFQGKNLSVGSQVIEFIASWFIHPDNKTGCRFIVVDAYNKDNILHFYEKNGFKFLYSSEELEKEANHIPLEESLTSRMMYLDLIGFVE